MCKQKRSTVFLLVLRLNLLIRWNRASADEHPARDTLTARVDNAGLILLWPFLPRLFQQLGLTSDDCFHSKDDQIRALLLTQYLVTGDAEAPEHWLLLNKLLCGVDFSIPVPRSIEVSEAETHLMDSLLGAVCEQWTPLRNTSIDGLRETFLQRGGLLKRAERQGVLTLFVDKGPFDMLLDQLPWPISVIRLSWMLEGLYVQWR